MDCVVPRSVCYSLELNRHLFRPRRDKAKGWDQTPDISAMVKRGQIPLLSYSSSWRYPELTCVVGHEWTNRAPLSALRRMPLQKECHILTEGPLFV